MKTLKFLCVALCMTLVAALHPFSTQAQVLEPGEQLEYRVSYIGITLGYIKLSTEQADVVRGNAVTKAKVYIDTAPGIPFVEFHSVFESWIDNSVLFSQQFLASTKSKEGWEYDRYDFLYPDNKIHITSGIKEVKKNEVDIITPSNKKWNDGCSLFYAARQMLLSGRSVSIPTAIMSDTSRTLIDFKNIQKESIEIDAVKLPVKTIFFKGEAKWKGIYGLEGNFEGWFSDDNARIPIKAKMKVLVGKVNIELTKWTRKGWNPPQ